MVSSWGYILDMGARLCSVWRFLLRGHGVRGHGWHLLYLWKPLRSYIFIR